MKAPTVNIAYPLRIASDGGTETAAQERHVNDMIEQLLLTAPGERVNRPDFGSGLYRLVFAPNSLELSATLQFSLQAALQRDLGDVIDVGAVTVRSDDAAVLILIEYRIRATGQTGRATLSLPDGAAP